MFFELPAGQARRFTVRELETGGQGLAGWLGTGSGKWRLTVTATGSVQVMSLLLTTTGHLTNLFCDALLTGSVRGASQTQDRPRHSRARRPSSVAI